MGKGTQEVLEQHRKPITTASEKATVDGTGLAENLPLTYGPRILLLCSAQQKDECKSTLEARGFEVEVMQVYSTQPRSTPPLSQDQLDKIQIWTFGSSSAVKGVGGWPSVRVGCVVAVNASAAKTAQIAFPGATILTSVKSGVKSWAAKVVEAIVKKTHETAQRVAPAARGAAGVPGGSSDEGKAVGEVEASSSKVTSEATSGTSKATSGSKISGGVAGSKLSSSGGLGASDGLGGARGVAPTAFDPLSMSGKGSSLGGTTGLSASAAASKKIDEILGIVPEKTDDPLKAILAGTKKQAATGAPPPAVGGAPSSKTTIMGAVVPKSSAEEERSYSKDSFVADEEIVDDRSRASSKTSAVGGVAALGDRSGAAAAATTDQAPAAKRSSPVRPGSGAKASPILRSGTPGSAAKASSPQSKPSPAATRASPTGRPSSAKAGPSATSAAPGAPGAASSSTSSRAGPSSSDPAAPKGAVASRAQHKITGAKEASIADLPGARRTVAAKARSSTTSTRGGVPPAHRPASATRTNFHSQRTSTATSTGAKAPPSSRGPRAGKGAPPATRVPTGGATTGPGAGAPPSTVPGPTGVGPARTRATIATLPRAPIVEVPVEVEVPPQSAGFATGAPTERDGLSKEEVAQLWDVISKWEAAFADLKKLHDTEVKRLNDEVVVATAAAGAKGGGGSGFRPDPSGKSVLDQPEEPFGRRGIWENKIC